MAVFPSLDTSRYSQRLDPRRIAALTVALALHVALGLLLLLPTAPLPTAIEEASSMVVGFIHRPPPPPPAAPSVAKAPAPERTRPPLPERPSMASSQAATADPEATAVPLWKFEPGAGVPLVVYGERPALDTGAFDTPPAELPGYRAGFEAGPVPGLDDPASSGSVTFDVLIEGDGSPSALVIRQQACSERALEIAMSVIGQWRFAPATRAGMPVQAWLEVKLDF